MQAHAHSAERFDVYREITNKIVAAVEAGAGAFTMPWHTSGPTLTRPTNALTNQPYRGVNVLALWVAAMTSGYTSGWWASYRQWGKLGAQVRRGEHGSVVVFYRRLNSAPAEDDDDAERRRLVARASRVFSADQVDGWSEPTPEVASLAEAIDHADAFVSATEAVVRHGGSEAFYRRDADVIHMPMRERFIGSETSSASESYYATLLHELTHWTGASHRLDRTFGARFGDDAYAMEELVAELGAAFLCAELQIANEPRADHAAYVAGWLRSLKQDRRAIFTAAAKAKDAVEYLGRFTE